MPRTLDHSELPTEAIFRPLTRGFVGDAYRMAMDQLMRLMSLFGTTPADRARVRIIYDGPENTGMARFFARKGG